MIQVIEIPVEDVVPDPADVMRALGAPPGHGAGGRIGDVLAAAVDELSALAEPLGILSEVDRNEFARIYDGDGDNAARSPLERIFPSADGLALFAGTVGAPVSERIETLFDSGDFALAATLDAAASESAELAAGRLDRVVLDDETLVGRGEGSMRALRYSPGYCGWNLTGQRSLFAALEPERIGIRLTDSCLMVPVKSISGVIVTGPREIHTFTDDYTFCGDCVTRGCRQRIRELRED